MTLKDQLADVLKHLEELEGGARKLANQNFADIVASARGRIHQLTNHPDVDLVDKELNGPDEPHLDLKAGAPRTNADPSKGGAVKPTFDRAAQ